MILVPTRYHATVEDRDSKFIIHLPFGNISTKPTHVTSFVIWLSVTMTCNSLGYDMNTFETIPPISYLLGNISLYILAIIVMILLVVGYEVCMFIYIYISYAVTCSFGIQLFLILPFLSMLSHTVHEILFLMNLKSYAHRSSSKFRYHIYLSAGYNGTMLVHVIYMGLTALHNMDAGDINLETFILILLGLIECGYRIIALICYIKVCIQAFRNEAKVAQYYGDPDVEAESRSSNRGQDKLIVLMHP